MQCHCISYDVEFAMFNVIHVAVQHSIQSLDKLQFHNIILIFIILLNWASDYYLLAREPIKTLLLFDCYFLELA